MYCINKEKARKVLLSQNYQPYQINILLENYPSLPDSIGELIEEWFDDHKIPELQIDGISLQEVMENRNSHFLVAIRDLSRLLDPSISLEDKKKWRKMLKKTLYYE